MPSPVARLALAVLAASLASPLGSCTSGGSSEPPGNDLTGDWDLLRFSTNDTAEWSWLHLVVGSDGAVQATEGLSWTGPFTPPAALDLTASLAADGTVTLAGADAPGGFHGSLAASHTLVVGTASGRTDGVVDAQQLLIWRRRVAGVTYHLSDLAGKAFTYHALYSGPHPRWERGTGSVDADGLVSIAAAVDSLGQGVEAGAIGTLAVDGYGRVTMPGTPLLGFLAPDREVAFLVNTTGDAGAPEPTLLVLVVTGAAHAQGDLAGTFHVHALLSGPSAAASQWNHGTLAVDAAGGVTFSDFAASTGATTLPMPFTLDVSSAGVITRDGDPTYRAQLTGSSDLYVRTSGAAAAPSLGLGVR
ncbi:MAG: hypothetical protein QM767_04360 [Anaeromyxobacter sp.]